jgi:streptogramin lyase
VWTLNLGDGTLTHVDPSTAAATTVDVGETVGFASDGVDLWVARDGNVLSRLDGETGHERSSIRPAARQLFALRDAGWLAVAGGSLWLTVPGRSGTLSQTLWRVDPQNGDVLARIPLAADPAPPFAKDRYVWITTFGDQGLTRIDVRSNEAVQVDVDPEPGALAFGDGSVWIGHEVGPKVTRFDDETLEVLAEVPLEEAPRGLAFGDGLLWVATESGLSSIDPATNEVTRTIELGSFPHDTGPIGIAYLDGGVWISIE